VKTHVHEYAHTALNGTEPIQSRIAARSAAPWIADAETLPQEDSMIDRVGLLRIGFALSSATVLVAMVAAFTIAAAI
jgi:hypothetical protein